MEKKLLLSRESSTTSSCTNVAVCNNSTSAAALYVLSLISPCSLALNKTNLGLSCLPLRFITYFMMVSSNNVSLLTASANFFSKVFNSPPIMLLIRSMIKIGAIYHSEWPFQSNLPLSFSLWVRKSVFLCQKTLNLAPRNHN